MKHCNIIYSLHDRTTPKTHSLGGYVILNERGDENR